MQYRKIEDCNQLLQGDPRIIQAQLIEYIIHLREEGKLLGYDTNDIELKWKKIKSYIGKGKDKLNRKDRPYTCVEISEMLEKADQQGRIAILLMSSSGIQVGALLHLKIRDLQRIEKYNLYKIIVHENEDEEVEEKTNNGIF